MVTFLATNFPLVSGLQVNGIRCDLMKILCIRGPCPFGAVQGRDGPRNIAKHEIGLLELEDLIQQRDRKFSLYEEQPRCMRLQEEVLVVTA